VFCLPGSWLIAASSACASRLMASWRGFRVDEFAARVVLDRAHVATAFSRRVRQARAMRYASASCSFTSMPVSWSAAMRARYFQFSLPPVHGPDDPSPLVRLDGVAFDVRRDAGEDRAEDLPEDG
jgi:hypothetical protein